MGGSPGAGCQGQLARPCLGAAGSQPQVGLHSRGSPRVARQGRVLREAGGGRTRRGTPGPPASRGHRSSSDAQRKRSELLAVVSCRPLAEAAANCVRSPPLPHRPPPTQVALEVLQEVVSENKKLTVVQRSAHGRTICSFRIS